MMDHDIFNPKRAEKELVNVPRRRLWLWRCGFQNGRIPRGIAVASNDGRSCVLDERFKNRVLVCHVETLWDSSGLSQV